MNYLVNFVWGNNMRNDVQIKATWVVDGVDGELYFDFYNTESKYIGDVIVTDKGKVLWHIADLNYEPNLLELINFIMGNSDKRMTNYETMDEDRERWKKACIYAYTRNLVVNRSQVSNRSK